MNHSKTLMLAATIAAFIAAPAPAQNVGDFSRASARDSTHASGQIAFGAASAVMAVASVPVTGSVAVGEGFETLSEEFAADGGAVGTGYDQPLPIADETFVAGPPPAQALGAQR